jgi:HEAT repeat protein
MFDNDIALIALDQTASKEQPLPGVAMRPGFIRSLLPGMIAILLALAATGWAPGAEGKDPVYAGKRLSEWLTVLDSKNKEEVDVARAALLWERKKLVPVLREDLKHGDERVAGRAARLLSELGTFAEPALPELTAALMSRHAPVRANAAYALSRIGPPARAAIDPLIELLGDKDSDARRWAAVALGSIGKEARRAVPALLRALEDREPLVRSMSAYALGEIGAVKESLPALIERLGDKDPQVRDSAALGLRCFGREAAPAIGPLIEKIRKDAKTRVSAGMALQEIGQPAVHGLIDLLKDDDAKVRSQAAYTLSHIGPEAKDAVAPLIRALKDPNKEVQLAATSALGKIGRPALPSLLAALGDVDEDTRLYVGYALAATGKPAIKPLSDFLKGPDEKARKRAALVLGWIGEPAVPALLAALKEKDAAVRKEAVTILGTISLRFKGLLEPLAGALSDPDEKVRQAATGALLVIGKPAQPLLMAALKNNKATVRSAAADALGGIASRGTDLEKKDIVALLVPLLGDEEEVQLSVAMAMMKIGKPAVPSLITALASKKAAKRKGAAFALGLVGDGARAAIPALRDLCNDADPKVSAEARNTLDLIEKP